MFSDFPAWAWTIYLGRVTFTIPVGRISSDLPQNLFFHRWSVKEHNTACHTKAFPKLTKIKAWYWHNKSHLARRRNSQSQHGKQRWVDGDTPDQMQKKDFDITQLGGKICMIQWTWQSERVREDTNIHTLPIGVGLKPSQGPKLQVTPLC